MSNYIVAVSKKWRCTLFALALVLTIAGCPIPNVQPYADATAQLRNAIQITGETTVTEPVEGQLLKVLSFIAGLNVEMT